MTFGMMYWLMPRLFQAPLWSKALATAHFWTATVGLVLYILPIYIAGLTQGFMWRALDDQGRLMYPDFVETVQALIPMYWVRVLGGAVYLTGTVLAGVNLYKTWRARPARYDVPVLRAPALGGAYADPPPPPSRLLGVPVLQTAHRIDVWRQAAWHRRWERLPWRFTVYVVIAVAVASLFEIIPTFLIRSNIPTIRSVRPYTPLELAGRDIFLSEGCYNCHSQQIRPILAETKRYGEYSKPGESVYDHPFQWGSRRIGPDLAREGGKQSSYWHVPHFQDPRQINPGSIMPAFPWLLTEDLDFDSIPARMRAMVKLGVPYDAAAIQGAVGAARKQAAEVAAQVTEQKGPAGLETKKVAALVAYLQRIGTDLFAPPPPEGPAAVQGT